MAAPRAASFRALNRISASSKQVRHLHMTGPATYASPLLTSDRPSFNQPADVEALRNECARRKLATSGSAQDLSNRLYSDALLPSTNRSFSTAAQESKRPSAESTPVKPATREFNTSRSLKTVNDPSTIDFAYLPDFDPDTSAAMPSMRVPLLPQAGTTTYSLAEGEEAVSGRGAEEVMRPEISLVSADGTHISAPSAMSDLHDNSSVNIDFKSMSERVAAATKRVTGAADGQASGMRTVWNGFLDDVFGGNKPSKA